MVASMRICRLSVGEIIERNVPVIGFYGMPPMDVLTDVSGRYPEVPFLDLDVFLDAPPTRLLPDAFCHIIRNCVDNALRLSPQLVAVVAAAGEEKCDAGRYAAALLSRRLSVEVITTTHRERQVSDPALLCESRGSLKKRVVRIMETVIEPLSEQERNAAFLTRCTPTVGFWGTPPHPIELLDLFPETTHVLGWTRCVEQGVPSDLSMELEVPNDLPVVFFSQGFCPKAMLARELAAQHGGMHVDSHDTLNAATIAKIEAFIRLSTGSLES